MAKERKREREAERERRPDPNRTDAPTPDTGEQSRGGKKRERKFGHN